MIVDFHTHVFSPAPIARRQELAGAEPGFGRLYANPSARMVTAEELLASMDAAGIDVSVILSFAWRAPELCRESNDYLLEVAAASGGRLLPFAMLPLGAPEAALRELGRIQGSGIAGIGELRPEDQGWDTSAGGNQEVFDALEELRLPLLFHVTEPVGHAYPGKGGFDPAAFVDFAAAHPGLRLVAAHWGGGLPFYRLMPEVRDALRNTWFDSSATSLLYEPAVFTEVCHLAGPEHMLFGSDYPLLSQRRQRALAEASGLDEGSLRMLMGENAARLLALGDEQSARRAPRTVAANAAPAAAGRGGQA